MVNAITINSRAIDGSLKRSWQAELVSRESDLLVFQGVFDRAVEHAELGFIAAGTISIEYYWLNEAFNVFKFLEPNGKFRNFYCNINLFPTFSGQELDYVDLDIDVLIDADFGLQILDVDEFETNATKFGYDNKILDIADKALTKLLVMFENLEFPFNQ